MAKRKSLSKRIRFDVFKRDGFECQYCGNHPPAVILHVDHLIAVANGGGNEMENLITSCEPCNQGKGARPLHLVPQSLKLRAVELEELEAQIEGYNLVAAAKRDRLEREGWHIIHALFGPDRDEISRDWLLSTRHFIDKLGLYVVLNAADIACGKYGRSSEYKLFRYFCGICWRRIRGDEFA